MYRRTVVQGRVSDLREELIEAHEKAQRHAVKLEEVVTTVMGPLREIKEEVASMAHQITDAIEQERLAQTTLETLKAGMSMNLSSMSKINSELEERLQSEEILKQSLETELKGALAKIDVGETALRELKAEIAAERSAFCDLVQQQSSLLEELNIKTEMLCAAKEDLCSCKERMSADETKVNQATKKLSELTSIIIQQQVTGHIRPFVFVLDSGPNATERTFPPNNISSGLCSKIIFSHFEPCMVYDHCRKH